MLKSVVMQSVAALNVVAPSCWDELRLDLQEVGKSVNGERIVGQMFYRHFRIILFQGFVKENIKE